MVRGSGQDPLGEFYGLAALREGVPDITANLQRSETPEWKIETGECSFVSGLRILPIRYAEASADPCNAGGDFGRESRQGSSSSRRRRN